MSVDPLTVSGNGAGPSVVVDRLSKWFGSVVAVNDVSFEIGPGVTGLLGPNGAGKTTLLRTVAGLTEPSEGQVRVFGEPPRGNPDLYRRVGVMSEHESAYEFLTGRAFVELNARLQKVEDQDAAVDRVIKTVDLEDAQHRPLSEYSRGMRQRMRLAATLVHDPPLLLLDEPLSGTDPRQRIHLQAVIRRLGDEGRTIVISSHILEEVEEVAEKIHLMVAGKLAASGDYRAIRQKLNDRPYHVRVDSDNPRALGSGLMEVEAVESVEVDEDGHIRVRSGDVTALQQALPRIAQGLDVRLRRVEPLDDSLESVFEYLSEGR